MKHSAKFVSLLISILFVLTINSNAQISRLEPERPRWGEMLTIIYDAAAPGAKFTPEDDVYIAARLTLPGFGESLSAKMTKEGKRFKYQVQIRNNLSAISFHFITLNGGWDESAYTTTIIYRGDGKPARGAYESKISSGRYQEFFKQETELYPDNYTAYRAKWSMAAAIEGEKAGGMINSDVKKLSSVQNESPELLYALSGGHLLLGREDKSRELIRRLFERFPESNYTGLAIRDYESEIANLGIAGAGPAEIAGMKLSFIQRNPSTEFARNASTVMAQDQRAALAAIETITEQWMKVEPENPQPHFNLAQAYKNQYQKYDRATPLIERAIDLLIEGKLRLYGDINGKQSSTMLLEAYITSADLAFRQTKYDKALSAVKVAQSFEHESGHAAHLLEAKIWIAMSQEARAEKAFIEAWRRGSQEAEERLKARYKEKSGSLEGFDEYLLKTGNKNDTNGTASMSKRPSPRFRVTSIDGKTFDSNALQGKVVVINLWFIACGPCRKEIPKLNQLVAEFKDKNVVFIAPSHDNPVALRSFLKIMPFDYNIIPNAEEIIISKFNATNFPTHIVIDQDGQIELMLVGGNERRPDEVRRVLLRLLNIQTSRR
ncbi:MAG: redoxin domain-containing protein [Acidobacteria bacterium]|nr:redoxin domain-containing protein [Acidobacteriota bacterium]MCI0665085.1 redoxin domain-containing protein [Acidobacteriota bacterium]